MSIDLTVKKEAYREANRWSLYVGHWGLGPHE